MGILKNLAKAAVLGIIPAFIAYCFLVYFSVERPVDQELAAEGKVFAEPPGERKDMGQVPVNADRGNAEPEKDMDPPLPELPEENGEPVEEIYTISDAMAAFDQLSLKDKLAGMLIMSKVDKGVVDLIFSMGEDGITHRELEEIREMLKDYLTDDQILRLEELVEKCRSK